MVCEGKGSTLILKLLLCTQLIVVYLKYSKGKDYDSHGIQAATCGLSGIRDNTSPSDPHILEIPFDDNLQNNAVAWFETYN